LTVKSIADLLPTERLYELSIEVRDLVQSKVGTTAFSTVWEQLRKRSVEKRGNRKAEQHRMVGRAPVYLRTKAVLTGLFA
jgi:hypothetical protein